LPPGFHAHLGNLYYQMGKSDLALQEFQKEKAQFPESAVFMDRLIANLAKNEDAFSQLRDACRIACADGLRDQQAV
jgi:hypothetical protein